VMGAGAGLSFIVGYTVLQQRATDDIRGRTFGAFNSGVRVAIFSSAIVVPTLIGLLGRERRVLTTLEDGSQAFLYPYTFGGVRITLIVAGVTAFVGAVVAGHTLRRALAQEQDPGLRLPPSEEQLPAQRHGLFVAFEGGDGAGKSTQIRLLRSAIERAGYDAVVTREPGGTPLGEAIREVLLDPRSDAMDDRTEALLYAAARAQHVREVIRPALEKGAVVLCDRYVDSSVVYQGVARGLGTAQVEELNRWATAQLVPDLVVLLDLDAEVGLERAGGTPDRLEAAGLEFHRRVASGFRDRARAEPDRYLVVDATRPVEQIQAEIRKVVLSRLNVADQEQADGEEDET
jgi:dTMP kinase